MLEKYANLLFFLKKSKNQSDERFIYLKITVDGRSNELSTKRKCGVSKWDPLAGKVKGNKQSVKELNNYLSSLKYQVHLAKRRLIESNTDISAQALKNILTGKYADPKTDDIYF